MVIRDLKGIKDAHETRQLLCECIVLLDFIGRRDADSIVAEQCRKLSRRYDQLFDPALQK